jgi:hypothetical protein
MIGVAVAFWHCWISYKSRRKISKMVPCFLMLLVSLPSLIPHCRLRGGSFHLLYIFLVSLLILQVQAALDSLGELPAFVDGVDFADPMRGGGSFLSHDSGGPGEPINVSLLSFLLSLPSSADPRRHFPCPPVTSSRLRINTMQVIISGRSSDWVLTNDGFVHFANAIGL